MEPRCVICLEGPPGAPFDFAVGCCANSKMLHAACVAKSIKAMHGPPRNRNDLGNRRTGKTCPMGCLSEWGRETLRCAAAVAELTAETQVNCPSSRPMGLQSPTRVACRKRSPMWSWPWGLRQEPSSQGKCGTFLLPVPPARHRHRPIPKMSAQWPPSPTPLRHIYIWPPSPTPLRPRPLGSPSRSSLSPVAGGSSPLRLQSESQLS